MITHYKVLFPDHTVVHGVVDWPVIPGRDLVGPLVRPYLSGEPYELVVVFYMGHLCEMAVSEIGHVRLSTRAPLALNEEATELYRATYRRIYPERDREQMPTIVGAAVIFDRSLT